jgi:feruloyl esterase
VIDFGWRSLHEVALAAKAVIQAHYGRPADLSLYNGCSTGGRQGLALAQRFPEDYDGIPAGAPANYWPELNAFHADFLRFLREDPARWVSPAKLEAVQRAVREECGAVDGLLDDPGSCRFDLSKLACAGEAGPDCLARAEIESLRRRFTDLVDEKGTLVYPGFVHGLETDIGTSWMGRSAEERGTSAGSWGFPVGFFRDYVHGDPGWQVTAFDLSRDLPAARQGLIGFSVATEDPDLTRFKARGGKLLQYHGWHDMGIPARNSIRYYEEVARAMGGPEAVTPFYRLFLGTGMGHCGGGKRAECDRRGLRPARPRSRRRSRRDGGAGGVDPEGPRPRGDRGHPLRPGRPGRGAAPLVRLSEGPGLGRRRRPEGRQELRLQGTLRTR